MRLIRTYIGKEKEKTKQIAPNTRVQDIQKEIDRRKGLYASLYTDLKAGILTQDEYLYAKKRYQEELVSLEQELCELQSVRVKAAEAEQGERRWEQFVSRYYKAETLAPGMLAAMVKEIRLYADHHISIEFRYMNEFEELFDECERMRREVA